MKTKEPSIIIVNTPDNSHRARSLSRNHIPWYLRAISQVEKWIMRKTQKIDLAAERIIRFYTYHDKDGQDFEFEVPHYMYDLTGYMYDDFVKISNKVGQSIHSNFGGVPGRYFYDVKVTLEYVKPKEMFQYCLEYTWEILKTDNPRCIFGNPVCRKDCCYLQSTCGSKLTIDGYALNGNYHRLVDILNDLFNKTIIVHSKADVKALMRIAKFLGVNQVVRGEKVYTNNPEKRAYFSKYVYGYCLEKVDGETAICAVHSKKLPIHPEDILDIDELIVKRSWKSKLRDARRTY